MESELRGIHACNTVKKTQLSLVEDDVEGKHFQSFLQDVFSGAFVHPTMPEIQPTHGPGASVVVSQPARSTLKTHI